MILSKEAGREYTDHETWNELANPETPIEQRKALVKKLFPEENKERLHQQAILTEKEGSWCIFGSSALKLSSNL
jgi:hypothetical protein